jgi:hypothetical protein
MSVITLATAMAQSDLRQNLMLESPFEGSNYLNGWGNNQHCCAHSVLQSSEQVKAGSSSLKLEVRSNDQNTSGSIRSEITLEGDPLNQDRWYGFSMFLKDWVDDDAGESVFEWARDGSGADPVTLLTSGGRMTLVTNGGTANNIYSDIGPIISNQWIDFVIHVRWATDTTGILQMWIDGNLVFNKQNAKTAAGTCYLKLGINKFGWSTQSSAITNRVLYFDEVRRGNSNATFQDVAPFLPKRDYFRGL